MVVRLRKKVKSEFEEQSLQPLWFCNSLVRGNTPAPRKPEVQYDHENSYQTQIYSHQGPTKFQKKTLKE